MSVLRVFLCLMAVSVLAGCGDDSPTEPDNGNPTTGTVTDIDGNVYQTIKIGDQWWMAENLKVKHYRNGEEIRNDTGNIAWADLSVGSWCNWYNDTTIARKFGLLYNWYAASDNRGIAPSGWHVPSDVEWQTLVNFLGGDQVAGGKMKFAGGNDWANPNAGATNESHFSALPGGSRHGDNGAWNVAFFTAWFWSSTEVDSSGAWCRELDSESAAIFRSSEDKRCGFSIRCAKD